MNLMDGIREAQQRQGWNDGELAAALKISHSVLSRILAGKRPVNMYFLSAVANVLPELKWPVAEVLFAHWQNTNEGENDTNNGEKSRLHSNRN